MNPGSRSSGLLEQKHGIVMGQDLQMEKIYIDDLEMQSDFADDLKEIDDLNSDISHNSGLVKTILSCDSRETASLSDFILKNIIGMGAFGKVYLTQNLHSRELFAMKIIRKDKLINQQQIESPFREKEIMMSCQHPFIINLDYLFQDSHRIYFLMRYVQGGDLLKHLQIKKRFKESAVQFYAAQIALAIGHLHSKRIIYRDLKLENILMNDDGYILLSDFGLSKILPPGQLSFTLCGTAAYIAPEILSKSSYDFKVDWWALGVLVFEMT